MVGVGARGPVALPLHNLGNVLVGGVPGSGKTECLASMLAGLLRFDASGSTVKVAVVDPKMVDFGAIPNNLQALMWPVAKTVEDAGRLIHAARLEVERRFTLLDAAGARNLAQFNATQVEALPYLVVMVDELADLTGDATFVEHALTIGRKGRAAGVTLVLATQRPSSDVVPSSLRAVCGAQVAFRVLNSRDSATVLGVGGAETLPAVPGRCLVRRSTIETVQAYHADLERRFYPFVGRLPRGDVKQLPAPSVERLPPVATGDDGPILADFSTLHRLPPVEVDATQVERIARGRRPTPAQAAQIRQLHAQGWSANRLSQRFWGYKDSDTLRFIREVLH
jgi:DNA segregation ATPase FtsK/SpoIIIE-like protein